MDPGAIDEAVLAYLNGDAALRSLLPDGVFMDLARPGATRFCKVHVVTAQDVGAFNGTRAIEDIVYEILAVVLASAGGDAPGAAARLDVLLEGGTFPIEGYALMSCEREERLRWTEVDDQDSTIRWYHRGGRYRVRATPVEE